MSVVTRQFVATAATVLLAPALIAQGLLIRGRTPRLPGAGGPASGLVPGIGQPLRLLVLGESTVAGIGAADHGAALTGQLAHTLARETGRSMRWRATGRSGSDVRTVHRELLAAACAEPADLVVLALGVNDTIGLRPAAGFRLDVLRLVAGLRRRLGPVPVLLAGVPPLGRFPALPQPLRLVLGLRARALDAALAQLAALPRTVHVPMSRGALDAGSFAGDGFHPGPEGYAFWGAQLGTEALRSGLVSAHAS
ncbi:SGNH/GDSL hydrolase family protein [Qaidamihabitans albus]|uniref:SGNH/GDSL hydrolase family protein n=1 Tax=Qaidamihabitans albus TaxID=2795733 RepID=UPI0018F1FA48|nr:SGNH/GDSL hydrolase family protein [Qaidamihabitans albus]